jgi:hypothetical protein
VAARFDDTMKRVLSVEKLRQSCEPIGLMPGKLVRVEVAGIVILAGSRRPLDEGHIQLRLAVPVDVVGLRAA